MGTGQLVGVALGILGMVGCNSTGGGTATLDPSSGYAKLRPGIVKAVTEFPADPGILARCTPGLGRVVILTLRQAAYALKIPLARPQPGFTAENVRTYADGHQEALERHDFADYNFGSFERATRFAVFSTVAATTPLMTDCERIANPNEHQIKQSTCKLTPGLIDGSLVVFEAAGRPSCAVRVRVEGPVLVAGSRGVIGDMSNYVQEVLQSLFDVETATGGRWLAKLRPDGHYSVIVEGAVVREPPPPAAR